ncbi:related to origin recognition complex subunit 5 [Rhynchosporium agropyri]|uniref:Related to origin recognition complex subunit 5 n=1 Tax=Rhynchosporium agropyri TaxID=914238 RepID=A0A1E1LF59_9HELO|nr:related to origin recognition complex subunit 5 [Rhynchosporium agropyri]
MASLFSLPNEVMLSALSARFPCRDQQIRTLATLTSIQGARSRNIVLHGLEATGKSAIVKALLEQLSNPSKGQRNGTKHSNNLRYAVVKSAECISGRHLLEQTVGAVAAAVEWKDNVGRCDNLARLVVELGGLVNSWTKSREEDGKFVLVFDGIDRQRDPPATLLQALARLGETIPNLTTIFIVTSPRPNFLHVPGVPHISFPAYIKPELLQIIALTTPSPELPKETKETWSRLCSAVWDSLSKHSGRDILSFRSVCLDLWPRFVKPILDGQLDPSPFSKLLLANRSLFQSDTALVHNILSDDSTAAAIQSTNKSNEAKYTGIGAQLPYFSRLLLVAAYLASLNPAKTDITFFMKAAASKRRKKGGGTALTSRKPGVTKHRKIARKLLGPQAFVLERMLAIFHAIKEDADAKSRGRGKVKVEGNADVMMAVSTLASLRLVVRMGSVSSVDVLDPATKYRVAVGWEVIRGIARSVGVEAEDYLAD